MLTEKDVRKSKLFMETKKFMYPHEQQALIDLFTSGMFQHELYRLQRYHIDSAFVWAGTPQRDNYWRRISDRQKRQQVVNISIEDLFCEEE